MRKPLIPIRTIRSLQRGEHGVTMILVALAMVAVIAMAALSIDVVTLYVSRDEAQRAADAGALAAARVISLSGITASTTLDTDVPDWTQVCGGSSSLATEVATAAAQENEISGSAGTVTVKYSFGSGGARTDCTSVSNDNFAVNPLVTVQVTQGSLPTLFSRIWSRSANSVSATATAEVLNPSDSAGVASGGLTIPVTPHCVKPWLIPNKDPINAGSTLVNTASGAITTPGIGGTATVGGSFTLTDACVGSNCSNVTGPGPAAGYYVPASVTSAASAFAACADDSLYQEAIGGCDVSTVYACGNASNQTLVNLTTNPGGAGGDTSVATQCLIHQSGGSGQDTLNTGTYPFQITAGASNPIVSSGQLITASNSVVTIPIYDNSTANLGTNNDVTVVGFLQVFIDNVDNNGNLNVHVLNVAGCGNSASTSLSAPGTSPVPIRLITPN